MLVGMAVMGSVGAGFTLYHNDRAQTAMRELLITEAKHDTGVCGKKQMVLIDEKTVVLGGYQVAASFLDRYTFVTTPDGRLQVLFKAPAEATQRIIMERPAKR